MKSYGSNFHRVFSDAHGKDIASTVCCCFLQTLFSMHQGVTSSWMGAVIACIELAIAASPLQLASYIPRFYFGSLLCFIGFDIMMDWLIVATKKVSRTEYALLIFTFLAVLNLGLELGIASGIVAASLMFSIAYSSTSAKAISVVPSRSGSVRPFHERIVLELFNARIAAVMLRGFLYFGSAAALTDHTVELAENILLKQPHVEAIDATSPAIADSSEPERVDPFASSSDFRPRNLTERRRTNPKTYNLGSSSSSSLLHKLLVASYDKHTVQMIASSPSQPSVASVAAALTEAPLVCLLDMSRVLGMDATAARALLTLHNRLNRRGVALALTGLRDDEPGRRLRRLLFGQGVILKQSATRSEDGITWDNDSDTLVSSDGRDASAEGIVFATDGNINRPDRGTPLEQFEITSDSAHIDWFPTMDAGMSHFEEIFLGIGRKHGLCPPSIHRMSIEETLRLNLMVPPLDFGGQVPDFAAASRLLEARCERKMVQAGDLLWRLGEDSNAFFILESASISCVADTTLKTAHARAVDASLPEELRGPSSYSPKRILRYGPGGIVGGRLLFSILLRLIYDILLDADRSPHVNVYMKVSLNTNYSSTNYAYCLDSCRFGFHIGETEICGCSMRPNRSGLQTGEVQVCLVGLRSTTSVCHCASYDIEIKLSFGVPRIRCA